MTPQETVDHLKKVRQEILADERMTYKSANVFSNAPLAIIQTHLAGRLLLCEKALGLLSTEIPIKKQKL